MISADGVYAGGAEDHAMINAEGVGAMSSAEGFCRGQCRNFHDGCH